MNGSVHRWLVNDATIFIKEHGNPEEQGALYRLENIAGGDTYIADIDPYNGYIQRTAGVEADVTDFHSDLQCTVPGFWHGAEYHGHWMTGLQHYLNAFLVPEEWALAYGYFYPWSSLTTLDDEFHSGWFDFLNVHIDCDPKASPILPRIEQYWNGPPGSFGNNFMARLPFSQYPPASVLAAVHYEHLINHFNDQMLVNVYGNNNHIQGLQKLGPVLHLLGDIVVPQHVRCAHGFLHQEWEDAAETLACDRVIDMNPDWVREFLSADPFKLNLYWLGGLLDRIYAVDCVMVSIADMTREKVQSALGLNLADLWKADDLQWSILFATEVAKAFVPAGTLANSGCMNYLYNLGVAAIVHTLKRAAEDLRAKNIGPAMSAGAAAAAAADRAAAAAGAATLPGRVGARAALNRPTLAEEPGLLLGRELTGRTRFADRVRDLEQAFGVSQLKDLNSNRVATALADLQVAAQQELQQQGANIAVPDERLARLGSRLGTYTMSPPTLAECRTDQLLKQYVARCKVQEYKAHLLNLTMSLAMLDDAATRCPLPPAIAQNRRALEQRRQEVVRDKALPQPQPPAAQYASKLIGPTGRPVPKGLRHH